MLRDVERLRIKAQRLNAWYIKFFKVGDYLCGQVPANKTILKEFTEDGTRVWRESERHVYEPAQLVDVEYLDIRVVQPYSATYFYYIPGEGWMHHHQTLFALASVISVPRLRAQSLLPRDILVRLRDYLEKRWPRTA